MKMSHSDGLLRCFWSLLVPWRMFKKKDQPAVEMFKTYWNSRSHWDVDWCFTCVSYRVLIHWLEKLAIQLLLQVYNPTGETVGILQKIMTSLWLLHLHLRTSNWLRFFSDGIPLDGPKTTAGAFHWTFHNGTFHNRVSHMFLFQFSARLKRNTGNFQILREFSETSIDSQRPWKSKRLGSMLGISGSVRTPIRKAKQISVVEWSCTNHTARPQQFRAPRLSA